MTLCDKCSEDGFKEPEKNNHQLHRHKNHDDCCGQAHSHTAETSYFGINMFKYGIAFMAGLTLAFFSFQLSKVYNFDIDRDGTKDVILERYFTKWKYFYKGDENSNELKPLLPNKNLTWEMMVLRFEAEKELLRKNK
jgi:hypothetical protein